jgi:hypothetical protein
MVHICVVGRVPLEMDSPFWKLTWSQRESSKPLYQPSESLKSVSPLARVTYSDLPPDLGTNLGPSLGFSTRELRREFILP